MSFLLIPERPITEKIVKHSKYLATVLAFFTFAGAAVAQTETKVTSVTLGQLFSSNLPFDDGARLKTGKAKLGGEIAVGTIAESNLQTDIFKDADGVFLRAKCGRKSAPNPFFRLPLFDKIKARKVKLSADYRFTTPIEGDGRIIVRFSKVVPKKLDSLAEQSISTPAKESGWETFSAEAEVPADAEQISFSVIFVYSTGTVDVKNIRVEAIE